MLDKRIGGINFNFVIVMYDEFTLSPLRDRFCYPVGILFTGFIT